MARNNMNRLGTNIGMPTSDSPLEVQQPEHNSGLSFVLPTEHVDLPSGGVFYGPNHPLSGVDTVEIKYMTAKEEDILTSQNLLRKGIALDKLLQSLIIDRRINPNDLLIGDKNAILVAARKTGYGSDYNCRLVCTACNESEDYEYDLDNCKLNHGGITEKYEDIVEFKNGNFFVTLPKTGLIAEIKLLTGHDEKMLHAEQEKRKKLKFNDSNMLTSQLKLMIVSLNGIRDRIEIDNFIRSNMPAIDSRFVRTVYSSIAPSVDMKIKYECSNCNTEQEVDVPMGTEFFWPRK